VRVGLTLWKSNKAFWYNTIISLKINMLPPWYSWWKIVELALNNNHSLYGLYISQYLHVVRFGCVWYHLVFNVNSYKRLLKTFTNCFYDIKIWTILAKQGKTALSYSHSHFYLLFHDLSSDLKHFNPMWIDKTLNIDNTTVLYHSWCEAGIFL